MTSRRGLWLALFVGYLLVLAVLLLAPTPDIGSRAVDVVVEAAQGWSVSARWVVDTRVEFLLNVLLGVPAPVLASRLWPRHTWQEWTAYVFIAAFSVEFIQGVLLPHRSATFSDVVANTLGALLGALAVRLVSGRPRHAGLV